MKPTPFWGVLVSKYENPLKFAEVLVFAAQSKKKLKQAPSPKTSHAPPGTDPSEPWLARARLQGRQLALEPRRGDAAHRGVHGLLPGVGVSQDEPPGYGPQV